MNDYDELLEMEPPDERYFASNPASSCGCAGCQIREPGTELARAENPIHLLTNPPEPLKPMEPMEAAAWAGGLGAATAAVDMVVQRKLPGKVWAGYVSAGAKLAGAFVAERAGHREVSTSLVSAAAYQAAWFIGAHLMAPPQPEAPPAPEEVEPPASAPPADGDGKVEGYYERPFDRVEYGSHGDSPQRMQGFGPRHETGYWHTQTDVYGRPVELFHPGY